MSKRKQRPERGARVTDDMSTRDLSSALGISTAELSRWKRLADVPRDQFEHHLANPPEHGRLSAEHIIRGGPVPARGRVQRALAMVRGMTPDELHEFLAELRRLTMGRVADA